METVKRKVTNALEIGQQITKNDFKSLVEKYNDEYPNTNSTFIIKSNLIEEVLSIHEKVAGIRFMYGLKDAYNPNSLVLFLIPCASLSNTNISTQAILMENGYLDHNGDRYTIQQMSEMMSWHVQNMKKRNSKLVYKEITRGNFYGKTSTLSLIENKTKFIQYDLGLSDDVITPIMQPLNKNLVPTTDIFIDLSTPCPTYCGISDPLRTRELCFSTDAVNSNSNDKSELDYYRNFRDTKLLELDDGAHLFEMYYFISPIVQQIISKNDNSEEKMTRFYNSEIKPFKELLDKGSYQEAVYSLKKTLYNLFEEYTLEKVCI